MREKGTEGEEVERGTYLKLGQREPSQGGGGRESGSKIENDAPESDAPSFTLGPQTKSDMGNKENRRKRTSVDLVTNNHEKGNEEPIDKNISERVKLEEESSTHSISINHPSELPHDEALGPQQKNNENLILDRMKQVKVVLTSKDTVRGVTVLGNDDVDPEISDEDKLGVARENSTEAVWAECNEQLSNLVKATTDNLDSKAGETCVKVGDEVDIPEETEHIEINPEWIKGALRRGCFVRLKNNYFSNFFDKELLQNIEDHSKVPDTDYFKQKISNGEGLVEANKRYESDDGRHKGKRKRSEDSDDEDIFARRNRKAVKYNCDTSDEEGDMDIARICVNVQDVPRKSVNAQKVPSSKLATSPRDDNLRKSVSSSSSSGEAECWSSKVFSNDYKDSCQVSFDRVYI